jgi:hypothetical protein
MEINMKHKFVIENVKGVPTLKTVAGTALLNGVPRLVVTKFGKYFVFPETVKNAATYLDLVSAKHRVFEEFETTDGSKAKVYFQTKDTPGLNSLKKGDWHVNILDIRLS